jgi:dihydroorotate dehydrogenase (fumarate)
VRTDTSYLGLRLPHPFIAGASPFGHRLDTVRRLEDAGCAAVVLHSLFEEQITGSWQGRLRHMDRADAAFAPTLAAFPEDEEYPLGPDAYAEHIRRVKEAVAIPVIGSLNGTSPESWLKFARVIERAGADAIELNLYEFVTDLHVPAAALEDQFVGIVREVKRMLRIPVAVKVMPFFTAFGNMAHQFDDAGADALVLFNRFYQPDLDITSMKVVPHVALSTRGELLLRLHWLAMLYGRIRPSLAVSGGIDQPEDAIKAILSGADAVQMVSALLRYGSKYVEVMRRGLEEWMEQHEVSGLEDMRGQASMQGVSDPAALERGGYIRTLQSWGKGRYADDTGRSRARD